MNFKKYKDKKFIYSLIAITLFIIFIGGYVNVKAQENLEKKVTIVPKNGDETVGIFSDSDGLWYPGKTVSKQFVIKNDFNNEIEFNKISVKIQSVDMYVLNKIINSDEDLYKEFLKNLKVQLKDGENIIFDDTFESFNKNGVLLNYPMKIASKGQKEFSLSLHFEETAGNIFQNLRHLFNLSIQYELKDGGVVTDKITNLPKTGGFYNLITFVVVGLCISGIGFIILGYKETSLQKGGNNSEK
ncbi:hypothetical protein [Clostridium omnivorum]|uniref:LPXTG cell wall anchor domain-containing protein n=1 Tax=Clostridium omnivorum TaxID=1604902 RepID=A0ABQ5N5L7_9CLOT|nr:hypothetical protein [Clostridium sp. E14]GLC30528.1 hypothetical protein bsdE14_19380 [Clostridium sp. E14]